ncbi:MAG: XRE family transcriptional regulator [Planctomycetaceae bacterium]|nr:MAG: XRE family transcriptional regulator [Planctomycetaceae bacterium]
MRFGKRVRELRVRRELTQQQLADRMGVSLSYINKVENEKLHFGDYPSEKFINRLATELDADEDELLLLTDRVPPSIRQRIQQQPAEFRLLAQLKPRDLRRLVASIPR